MACCGQATNGLMGYGGGLGRSYLEGGTLTAAEVAAKNAALQAGAGGDGIPLWAYAAGGALVVGGIAYVVLSPKKATPNRRRSRRSRR